jgi:excisionase family DNA binding protein
VNGSLSVALSATQARPHRLAPLNDAADYAKCHPRTIRRRIADGSLTGYRMGPRLIRVDLNELDSLLSPIPTMGATA